ncbi:rhodanese-like domain-containing protein [Halobacteriovorax sp. GB3]|uniref:rhodanese-like domain-containing protein n=1 Tax=Halobacteriovorax sp. GB3 TaxID=2719615 RepID=UPI0023616AA8|nr:rhodanese-like domain-containing protein [Halobacteriovorax sp. GB3]MDD0854262.1 rhodanese-like domain-containing protein [Halobacteriovorax sp. GB3]
MINSMDVVELKKLIDTNENLLLVDCREQDEWDAGHIKEAKFVPLSRFQELFESELPSKDAKIIMQCRSGKRSMNACMFLMEQGYEDLTNLEGGILAWQENGFEIVK